jgi:peptidoglycan/xylan/chitin deacetylase (PgdA/CDA1 family)
MYHRVRGDEPRRPSEFVVSASTFRRQMSWLARHGYFTPRMSDVLRDGGRAPCVCGRPVVITFDDGYRDVLENAVPVLRSFGFTAAVFPVLDLARRFNHWDEGPALSGPLLTPDELRAVEGAGLELGSHTMTHAALTRVPDDALRFELARSREVLARIVSRPIPVLAYPYGEVDERVKDAAREAGYDAALAVGSGPLDWRDDGYEIRRQRVGDNASDAYMRFILSGAEKLYAWSKWKVRRGLGSMARHPPRPALNEG